MIAVHFGAEQRHLADGATVGDLLAELGKDHPGIAVAVNDRVVSRGQWHRSELPDGARVEIMTAVPGG